MIRCVEGGKCICYGKVLDGNGLCVCWNELEWGGRGVENWKGERRFILLNGGNERGRKLFKVVCGIG